MTNIIGNTVVLGASASTAKSCSAIIGFKSVLPESAITGANENSLYPFSNCLDFRDNTQYSPAISSGSVTIEFNQLSETEIDYIGVGIHNGKTAGFVATLEVLVDGVWETKATFTPTGDNKTMMEYFDAVLSSRQRLTINFEEELFIGNIYLGKGVVFSKAPALGFTPGHTNSLDQLASFDSETNQFIMARQIKKGFGQKGQFNFIPWSGETSFETEYVDYMNHMKLGKPVFMKWNKNLQQNFFGRATNPNSLQAPTYETNDSGTFYFDYKGFA